MEQANTASVSQDNRKERRRRMLLVLLLVLVLVTTSMVGYVLGRSASGPLGQVTDTVLLSPQNSSARTATHLTGQVVYQDGTPAAGLKLELHSNPIVSDTDDRGVFLFPNVPFGEHHITVFASDGSVAAERPVSVVQSADEQGVSITKKSDGASTITVAVDVRILEISIKLGDEGALEILPTGVTFANGEGKVVTPTGLASVESGIVVTPRGHVCLPDGTIVIPRSGKNTAAVILPNDTVIYPEHDLQGSGYAVKVDGTVTLPTGTEIRPGGIVVTPGGEQHEPGAGGVVVSGDNVVTPIGGGSSSAGGEGANGGMPGTGGSSSGGGGHTGGTPGGTSSGGGAAPNTPSTGGTPGTPDVPDSPDVPDVPDNPDIPDIPDNPDPPDTPDIPDVPEVPDPPDPPDTPDPPPDGSLFVYGENRGGTLVQWVQNSTIDLFYNRTSGMQEKIAPGSAGYYRFQLQNTLSSKLNVSVTLRESTLHLPLAFTLTPLDESGNKLTEAAVRGTLSSTGGLSLKAEVAAKAVVGYQLDWVWPAEGNDALDTRIGSGDNLTYFLSMIIHAEQV